MKIREDTWLSERFGHQVFSVRDPGPDAAELVRHASGRERATYQARVGVDGLAAVSALEAAGMRVVNVTVTLAANPAAATPGGDGWTVRDAAPAGDETLLDVAGRSFTSSRFHLDPAVPREVADDIKREWVRSYLDGKRGEQLLVAERDGQPAGFLAILSRDDGGRRIRVIDLVAVAPEAQGSGAGTALVRRFHEESAGRCDAVEVGTQLANAPAMAFYERLGYVTSRSAYDLHLHV